MGDHEFLREESHGNTSTLGRSELPFWMRCKQPEIILAPKAAFRPLLEVERRSEPESMHLDTANTNSGLRHRASIFDQCLSNLNEKITTSYLLKFLLTGCSFAIFAVIYGLYVNTPINVSQLKEMIRSLEMENGELKRELSRCQIGVTSNIGTQNEQNECKDGPNSIQGRCNERPPQFGSINIEKQVQKREDGRNRNQVTNLSPIKQFTYEHLGDEVIHNDLFRPESKSNDASLSEPMRRTASIEAASTSDPGILTNNYEFNDLITYDDYDYVEHKSQHSNHKDNKNMVSIEEVLLQIDEHLDHMTQSCYLKYKQLKGDNTFKAQKMLLKLKKKKKNKKRERTGCGEDCEKVRKRNERKRDKYNRKNTRKSHENKRVQELR